MREDWNKELLSLGFREYTPSSLEDYNRAWQLSLKKRNEHINVNWYNFDQCDRLPEVELYKQRKKYVEKTLFYSFDSWEGIIKLIENLLKS